MFSTNVDINFDISYICKVISSKKSVLPSIWNKIPILKPSLQKVLNCIERQLCFADPNVNESLIEFLHAGGKLIRPVFFLLFAHLGEETFDSDPAIIETAAALELLHMATLVHDDIIDNSPLRRGIASIQNIHGKSIAVYAGDYLLTVFFTLIAKNISDKELLVQSAASMQRLLEGELHQYRMKFNPEITVSDYFQIIEGKTAELFYLSCYLGISFAKNKTYQEQAKRIGKNIGCAFQIIDDILDYDNLPQKKNIHVREDLAQGVYSLPLILAMEENPDYFKNNPHPDKKSQEYLAYIADGVEKLQGVQKAQAYAKKYSEAALKDIQELPDGITKKLLLQLTDYLLERKT
ncbi:polyprenyl synthetase [Treponema phagedenis F0421]|nr:polyprenyl synthetase [Treponema phagedenis F0421]